MSNITTWIFETFGIQAYAQYRIAASVIIILLLWLSRKLILNAVFRRTVDVHVRYRWRKSTLYIAVTLGIVFFTAIWMDLFRQVGTFLGLLSAGLTIALKDLVSDVAGWIFILWRRPFEVGDRVEIEGMRGDVIDIRMFQFTLMEIGNWVNADQSTGRVVHIPNGLVLSGALANYSKGFQFIWNEIGVLVTFESNWRDAKQILQDIASKHAEQLSAEAEQRVREAARRFLIFYSKLTPIVYTSVQDSGVLLTVRYLCKPQRRRGSEESMWEDILTAFAQHDDIDFAYPTRRYYDNRLEGEAAARRSTNAPPDDQGGSK